VDNPCESAVTIPELLIDATVGLLEIQVPPVDGEKLVVAPIHNTEGPLRLTTGLGFTSTGADSFELQPVTPLVKVNFAVPADIPVTIPVFVIAAIPELDEIHIPPLLGDMVVVVPIQIELIPVIEITGLGLMVTGEVGSERQPLLSVYTKVTFPPDTPVTKPVFVIVAIDVLLLDQVPP
jgi:hypothetical protein